MQVLLIVQYSTNTDHVTFQAKVKVHLEIGDDVGGEGDGEGRPEPPPPTCLLLL